MKILSILLLLAMSGNLFASEDEPTNEEIMQEIRDGRKPNRGFHFVFNVKPLNFILAQAAKNSAPIPINPIQAKARIIGHLGIQAEPIFVVSGHGGGGFSVGPALIPRLFEDEATIIPKYVFTYVNQMGGYHGAMLELASHYLMGHFALTYGGAIGFNINGTVASKSNYDGSVKVREVNQGFAYEINLGLGFAI